MEKVYIFGAGRNGYSVIKFIGKENIISVVDNNQAIVGTEAEGMIIIDFSEFLEKYHGETVVIAAYFACHEIKEQLKKAKITNFVVAPYMQKGYYESYQDIIARNGLDQIQAMYIYGENYFSKRLYEEMQKAHLNDIVKGFVRDDNFVGEKYADVPVVEKTAVPGDAYLVLAVEPEDSGWGSFQGRDLHIIDLYRQTTVDHTDLRKFKDIHSGERVFIIGNGPSLRSEDLDKLMQNKEWCFGSNFITKVFDQTAWRPDYYAAVDFYTIPKLPYEEIKNVEKFIADLYCKDNVHSNEKMNYYQSLIAPDKKFMFSSDIVKGVYTGLTVTYDMLQIAAYMGFKEIYLLGVDCANAATHFYESGDQGAYVNSLYDHWPDAYQEAEKYSREHNFRIFNATRGGKLEVFERVDFDSLF